MPSLELAVRQAAWRLRQGKTVGETRAEMAVILGAGGAAMLADTMRIAVDQFTAANRWKTGPPGTTLNQIVAPDSRFMPFPEARVTVRIDRDDGTTIFRELSIPIDPSSVYGEFQVAANNAIDQLSQQQQYGAKAFFFQGYYIVW